jgi:3',5'-cyclic AMP phosphodiesterase CpdA
MFSVAHLSDLHATPVRAGGLAPLLNKRLLGWLSWRLRRSRLYRPQVLEALIEDLRGTAPDQVVVTGDLTNVALEDEFAVAHSWLRRIGGADRVSVVPGNHDAYVQVPRATSWDQWWEFMASDPELPGELHIPGGDGGSGHTAGFPTLRIRGPAAFVGVCTARPTRAFRATGRVGADQLERLEQVLSRLADSSLCRILLIHHPVGEGAVSSRRALTDAPALRGVLRRAGADLVLHGHTHRTLIGGVAGPRGAIPVVGVRAASRDGGNPLKRSQYHLYQIDRRDGEDRFRVTLCVRSYEPATGRFSADGERVL